MNGAKAATWRATEYVGVLMEADREGAFVTRVNVMAERAKFWLYDSGDKKLVQVNMTDGEMDEMIAAIAAVKARRSL